MKKRFLFALLSISIYMTAACGATINENTNNSNEVTITSQTPSSDGEVIVMNKQMFIDKIHDYKQNSEWTYKGNKPAIIDLYADWCGPCRKVAPIMKELAKEYADEIVIYKVNVDKERELASFFSASSIPLFVFIPVNGDPQLMKGAADKDTYKKIIDSFLLGKE